MTNTKVAINFGHCAEHYRGGDWANQMRGEDHARWLCSALELYRFRCPGLSPRHFFVSITGWPGWPDVDVQQNNLERDWYWEAFRWSRFVTMAQNPGHQQGAAWTIRLGLECAGKLGYDCLIHTCEDIFPTPDAVATMLEHLTVGGYEYVGQAWSPGQVNAQFFGCQVGRLAGLFDPCAVWQDGSGPCLERYLGQLLEGRAVARLELGRLYRHTHDWPEWRRWCKEVGL
jgi:hypothetical protein